MLVILWTALWQLISSSQIFEQSLWVFCVRSLPNRHFVGQNYEFEYHGRLVSVWSLLFSRVDQLVFLSSYTIPHSLAEPP